MLLILKSLSGSPVFTGLSNAIVPSLSRSLWADSVNSDGTVENRNKSGTIRLNDMDKR